MSRVMLIEDEIDLLALLKTLLEFEGYQVVTLPSGVDPQQILVAVRQDRPDLVFLDVYLRGANGLDVVRLLRQDVELQDVRVLMSSGMDLSQACLQAGADAFLPKPYMPDELTQTIRDLLRVNFG